MYKPLMKCGHTANAETSTGEPCCAICAGFTEDAYIVVPRPSLEGRKAKCSFCGNIVDSDYNLPFFEYKPENEYDSYYDGCGGWD